MRFDAGQGLQQLVVAQHELVAAQARSFRCIRLFTTENGWVGDFTGSDIAERFPSFDAYVASLA